jgi:hypothetical protein
MSSWTISPTSPFGRLAEMITFIAPNSQLGAANQSRLAEVGTWQHVYAGRRDQDGQVMHELTSVGCRAPIGTSWPALEAPTRALADDRSEPRPDLPRPISDRPPYRSDIRTIFSPLRRSPVDRQPEPRVNTACPVISSRGSGARHSLTRVRLKRDCPNSLVLVARVDPPGGGERGWGCPPSSAALPPAWWLS